jgi:hypothetical protein
VAAKLGGLGIDYTALVTPELLGVA